MPDEGISDGSSWPEYLQPGDQYIAPASGLAFGQLGGGSGGGDQPPSLLQFLPYRSAADRLMAQYFASVHVVAPCSHRPSLETAYASFWEEVQAGFEPRPSTQTVIFAALFSAIVSMDEQVVAGELGGFARNTWLSSLKMGVETALSRANFLQTTKTETMQGFIMYMLALCRAEVTRAHAVLVGAAVRLAECMGLNRDGEAHGLTPLETHVRRLMWHQLCFLDIRTCEVQAHGQGGLLRPVIRREDYDTKLPLRCDEAEITHEAAPAGAGSPSDSDRRWTANTLSLIRFEINEMTRIVWLDRRKLEDGKTTLEAVLAKIETFRQRLSAKYDGLLLGADDEDRDGDSDGDGDVDVGVGVDVRLPTAARRYARCVMYLLTYRLHVMALHPYNLNPVAAAMTCSSSSHFADTATATATSAHAPPSAIVSQTVSPTTSYSSPSSPSKQTTSPPRSQPYPPLPPPTPPPLSLLLPPRLNHLLVASSIAVQELAIQLATDPAFAPWAWYAGAYSQHQEALLLLAAEVSLYHHHQHPQSRHGTSAASSSIGVDNGGGGINSNGSNNNADRIWPCLDWVFGLDRRLPREIRALGLLAEVHDRTAVYLRLRRRRGPTGRVTGRRGLGRSSSAHAGPAVSGSQGRCQGPDHAQNRDQHGLPPLSPPLQQPPPPSRRMQPQKIPSLAFPTPQQQRRRLDSDGGGSSIKVDPAPMAYVAPALSTRRRAPPPAFQPPQQPQQQQQMMAFADLSGRGGDARFAVPPPSALGSTIATTTAAVTTPTILSNSSGLGMRLSGDNRNGDIPTTTHHGTAAAAAAMDAIDWDTVNSLFPTDPQHGGLSAQGFQGLNMGVPNWGGT
ncbi:hypothetical protein SLS62_008924 [Diatrype stigma]|uniref:Xylanolytic transcriptional activator regulatory domain-containing protein n=1 Tax=Diatrype stigma TaxID=117547 RepID=A0AAN9YM35_9PEZI